MNIGVYVGSFDPIHIGHKAVIQQAEEMFDLVIVGLGVNPSKNNGSTTQIRLKDVQKKLPFYDVVVFENVFDLYNTLKDKYPYANITIIRGIRDYRDLEPEYIQILQDRGINCTLIKTPNSLSHVSSKASRELSSIGEVFHKTWFLPLKTVTGVTGKICSGKSTFMQKMPTHSLKLSVGELTREVITNFLEHNQVPLTLAGIKRLVFHDPIYMELLVALTKPKVIKRIRTAILNDKRSEVYIEDAMLIENQSFGFYDNFVFISAVEEDLVQRLMARNSLSREEAEQRLSFFKHTSPFNLPKEKVSIVNTSINP